jgi:hypothetical protein
VELIVDVGKALRRVLGTQHVSIILISTTFERASEKAGLVRERCQSRPETFPGP